MNQIKEYRKAAGLTQSEMSSLMDIPMRTISNWESHVNEPPIWAEKLIIEKLVKIAEKKESKVMRRVRTIFFKGEADKLPESIGEACREADYDVLSDEELTEESLQKAMDWLKRQKNSARELSTYAGKIYYRLDAYGVEQYWTDEDGEYDCTKEDFLTLAEDER